MVCYRDYVAFTGDLLRNSGNTAGLQTNENDCQLMAKLYIVQFVKSIIEFVCFVVLGWLHLKVSSEGKKTCLMKRFIKTIKWFWTNVYHNCFLVCKTKVSNCTGVKLFQRACLIYQTFIKFIIIFY